MAQDLNKSVVMQPRYEQASIAGNVAKVWTSLYSW